MVTRLELLIGLIVLAQHKRGTNAVLGKTATSTDLPFSCFAPNTFGAKQEKGRCSFLVWLPRAALHLPGAIIISSSQDCGLARSARKFQTVQIGQSRLCKDKVERQSPIPRWMDEREESGEEASAIKPASRRRN